MRVFIPSPLQSYTGQQAEVNAEGTTLADVLSDLDRRYPGFRFRIVHEQDRIREHIRIFINRNQTWELMTSVSDSDEIQIICALSGG
ncbi:MAG: MoaD/ThiS family protein [Nitrospirae bacterium]|nr:MoaD/ThiS family protein [Nitrospirota bacterium]